LLSEAFTINNFAFGFPYSSDCFGCFPFSDCSGYSDYFGYFASDYSFPLLPLPFLQ